MLLQIHEPGESPLPHSDDVAVGIDLGTTNSLVAISHDEMAEIICGADGKFYVESVLSLLGDGSVVVGDVSGAAKKISSVKRLMGLGYAEAKKTISDFGFDVDPAKSEKVIRIKLGEKELTPIEISAEILKALKANAEAALGKTVSKAVITVPAYFNDAQRQATKDAAKIAGLETLRLINEPTAAALAYGLDRGAEGVFAIFDLGGGTFDVSILKMQMGVFKVIATGGDTALGGDDFDLALAVMLKQKYFKNGSAIASDQPPRNDVSVIQLKPLARKIKEQLTFSEIVKENFAGVEIEVTRAEYEAIIGDLADKTISIFERTIKDSKLKKANIDGVVLVGGATRTPLIRAKIESLTGKKPLIDIDPDKVVAMGAAIQAEALTKGSNNLLLDVTPLSLGLETYGGLMEVLVPRNTPIPVSIAQKFTTYEDGQSGMNVHVLQGEREFAKDCRSLAKFDLKGIPPKAAGTAIVEVSFMLDADGILTVSAREETTGTEQVVEVRPSYGLGAEEMEKILITSIEQAKSDIMNRLLAESRVEADIAVKTILGALKKDGNLISNDYKARIEAQIEVIAEAVKGTSRDRIDVEVKQLDAIGADFADLRTSAALSGYLSGKKVNEV